MRRFVTLFALLFLTVPFGISIAGCGKKQTVTFCTGDSGPVVGQVKTINLSPNIYGISLNSGQFGSSPTAAAIDCNGNAVTVSSYTWAIRPQDVGLVDVVPATGRLCAGTWNRNTGGGIANYTVCTPATRSGTAAITATAQGTTSSPLPIFVHPVITSIIVGPPSTNCTTDLATNCCAFSTVGATTTITGNYTGNSCLSQNVTGQLAARAFAGGSTDAGHNVTCTQTGTDSSGNAIYAPLVGHVTFTPTDSNIVTIDENGVATAKFPGSTIVNASVSNASSTNGYFSTCPPANIVLTTPNTATPPSTINVNQNNTQPLVATITDTNGVVLNGVPVSFVSTTPTTLPSGGTGTVTPIFPGAGAVTAVCLPPACNNSPLSEIGLFGNGLPVVSNQILVKTPGTNSSVLYAGSTTARELVAIDFNTSTVGTPVRLPYIPNSMVISNDGSTLYLGSATELMIVSAANTAVTGEFQGAPGKVLAVSPDSATVVVADPTRQTVSLVTSAGAVTTTYGGLGTHAQFSPDSGTVYIAAGNQLLVHSTLTGWTSIPVSTPAVDVSVATPAVGAFLAGATTAAHGYCPITTISGTGDSASTTNQFYPDAGLAGPATDRLTATNDGFHVIGATVTPGPVLTDLLLTHTGSGGGVQPGVPTIACPGNVGLTFTGTAVEHTAIPGITATEITGVPAASDSSIAFVTYTGSGSVLPSYTLAGTGAGSLTALRLSGTAVAPVSGAFSSDNNTFFAGTSGDNLIHLVTRSASGFADTGVVDPKIVNDAGTSATPDLVVQRPRKTT